MWTMLRKSRRGLAEICVLFSMDDSCNVAHQDSPHVRSRETETGFERTIFSYSLTFITVTQGRNLTSSQLAAQANKQETLGKEKCH